jgi:hypothetical protein
MEIKYTNFQQWAAGAKADGKGKDKGQGKGKRRTKTPAKAQHDDQDSESETSDGQEIEKITRAQDVEELAEALFGATKAFHLLFSRAPRLQSCPRLSPFFPVYHSIFRTVLQFIGITQPQFHPP